MLFSFCPADGAVLRCGGVPGQPVHLLDHRKHLGGHVSSEVQFTLTHRRLLLGQEVGLKIGETSHKIEENTGFFLAASELPFFCVGGY